MPQRPDNRHDRFPRQLSAWLAAAVIAGWMLLFLRHPLWSTSVAAEGSDVNGPRWYLLLAPDGILAGWFHGPVTSSGLIQRLSVLAVAALVAGAAYAAGWPLVSATAATRQLRRLERHLLAAAAGLSVCSLVTLLVGLAGGVGRPWSAPLISLLSILVGWGSGRLLARRGARSDEAPAPGDATVAGGAEDGGDADAGALLPRWAIYVPRVAAGLLGCLLIARAIMPPAEYDVREYHLQAPKEWSSAGRITFLPHNIYANMPMGAEMHALLAIDWWRIGGGDLPWWWGALSGKVILAGYALLAAALVGCAVARFCGPVAGTWTTAFGMATPVLAEGATLGLIEAAVACYLAAGLVILASRMDAAGMSPAAAAWLGFFAGSAVACKYPAVLFVALPLMAATVLLVGPLPKQQRLVRLLLFILLAAVAAGPWLAKNAVLAGNPVYPLVASLLGGRTMTPDKIAQWNAAHATGPFTIGAVADSLSRLSWRMQTQSAIVLPMAIAALIIDWRRREVRYPAIAAALSLLLWWVLTHRIERFLVPVLPLVLVLAGFGWRALAAAWGPKLLTAVAVFGITVDALIIASPVMGDSRIAVDLSYLRSAASSERHAGLVPEHVQWVNATLGDGDRILLIGDAAVFDYDVPLDYATTFDRSPLRDIIQAAPPERWRQRLRDRGYTHLLVHWGEIQRLRTTYGFDTSIDHTLLANMQQAGAIEPLRMGLSGGQVDVYRVVDDSEPRSGGR